MNGEALPPTVIRPGENAFALSFAIPDSAAGKPDMTVAVEAGRAAYELGLPAPRTEAEATSPLTGFLYR